MKSWNKPTPELVNKALASTPRAEQLAYFFNKLSNPFWIEPIQEHGYFSSPLKPMILRGERAITADHAGPWERALV
jgi:hypothetical protein